MQLRDWQCLLQEKILSPSHERDEFGRLYDAVGHGKVAQSVRFGIYQQAYSLRLIEALKSNYPALHHLLGDDDFDAMAEQYLHAFPSADSSIRWFGKNLAEFLNHTTPYALQPVFTELAQFEWALRHTLDAADAASLSVADIKTIPPAEWPGLYFSVHPSLSTLPLQWNTPQIWQALTAEQTPPAPQLQPAHWLVYRNPDLSGAWRSASEIEVAALSVIQSEKSFADMCAQLLACHVSEADIPAIAAGFLRAWVEQGLLAPAP